MVNGHALNTVNKRADDVDIHPKIVSDALDIMVQVQVMFEPIVLFQERLTQALEIVRGS